MNNLEVKKSSYRPGAGWKHLSGPVWEYTNGARIHLSGLIRLPDGTFIDLHRWPESKDISRMVRINGGNVKRGLMAKVKLEYEKSEYTTTEQDSEGTMKYNDYEQVNGATVNALLERIEKLERMLIVINESWSVEDYVEGELFDEIIKEIGQSVDTHATTD